MAKRLYVIALIGLMLLVVGTGCRSAGGGTGDAENGSLTRLPIPPESPFAKIKKGMSMGEVASILGQPTEQETYITGKAFAPFYFGGDTSITKCHYKGLGRIKYARRSAFGGALRVVDVEYDPDEPGFIRSR